MMEQNGSTPNFMISHNFTKLTILTSIILKVKNLTAMILYVYFCKTLYFKDKTHFIAFG